MTKNTTRIPASALIADDSFIDEDGFTRTVASVSVSNDGTKVTLRDSGELFYRRGVAVTVVGTLTGGLA